MQEIYHENGVYYGQNVISKNMIIANRRNLLNGNSFILGVSGAGKSFTCKEEISSIILTDPNADVISERRYYVKWKKMGIYLDEDAESDQHTEIKLVEGLLNDIENEQLYKILSEMDKLALQIILWKIEGYSSMEISEKCRL